MSPAVVVQSEARPPNQAGDSGSTPARRLLYALAPLDAANALLAEKHYLGPIRAARHVFGAFDDDVMVACQVWKWPTARMLPNDGSWLELARWCTGDVGQPGGSSFMAWTRRWIIRNTDIRTLVSYSELGRHEGTLYRASGWVQSPTHHAMRYLANGRGYPSGHGSWDGKTRQAPKMRWIMEVAA